MKLSPARVEIIMAGRDVLRRGKNYTNDTPSGTFRVCENPANSTPSSFLLSTLPQVLSHSFLFFKATLVS
jgi:hypothetical protein